MFIEPVGFVLIGQFSHRPRRRIHSANSFELGSPSIRNFERFERLNLDYQKTALMVRSELDQGDYDAAMRNFFKMARSCKACHENFRN